MTDYIMILIKMKPHTGSLVLFLLFSCWQLNAFAEINSTSQSVLRYQKQMAKRGSATAQFKLGLMYETGLGVNASKVTAAHWYKQAATQHYQPAINRLTYLDIKNNGFKKEDLVWLKTLKKDALLKQGEALFLLGKMYSEGTGVEKSLTRALSLLREAEAKNISGSETEINRIEQELSILQAQYITAQEKARVKSVPIKNHQKSITSNLKILPTTLPPKNHKKQPDTANSPQNSMALQSLTKERIVNAPPPTKKPPKAPGLVIKISKPLQLSEVYTPHPMDLICAGKNQFRRSCR